MNDSSARPKRSYPKGVTRREEIVRAAFDAFAEQGYHASSLREIARRVGLTQAGLMHHFASKEELLTEVLAIRDAVDSALSPSPEAFSPEFLQTVVEHNERRQGIVRLFTMLSAEATDPAHPAHPYFADRLDDITAILAAGFAGLPCGLDPTMAARLAIAVMDGLQIQWLLNPRFQMSPAFAAFVQLLESTPAPPPSTRPTPARRRTPRR